MSKKCPNNKIINPITNRCVKITGSIGKKLSKKNVTIPNKYKNCNKLYNKFMSLKNKINKSKKKTKKPKKRDLLKNNISMSLDKKYYNICDKGLVSENKINELFIELSFKIGEFQDVYCVANNKKDLAALDYSNKGKTILRRKDKVLINKVIKYANYKNVQYIHNKKIGGMYLKSIFFLPHNITKALKLMYILWYQPVNLSYIDYQIAIGLLLGYENKNIIYFIKTRYTKTINIKNINKVNEKIKRMKINLEDLQQDFKIVHNLSIEKII